MNPIFLVVVMFVVMWFLLLRPQMQERKAKEHMFASLKKGDRIVTIGGIFGTISAMHEHEIVIKVDEKSGAKLRILKTAVHQRLGSEDGPAKPETEEKPASGVKSEAGTKEKSRK